MLKIRHLTLLPHILVYPITKFGGMEAESARLCIHMVTWITIVKPVAWVFSFIQAYGFRESADHEGRAAIRMDGVEVLRSNYYIYFENVWTKFTQLRSTTMKDCDSTKEAINLSHAHALEQGTFDQKVFYEAFGIFDNQSIEKSLVSENPLVRIFALLDRRLGKRRLLALEESMEQELDWVRAFYVTRMQAEGLMDRE